VTYLNGHTKIAAITAAVVSILVLVILWVHELEMSAYRDVGYVAMEQVNHISVTQDTLKLEIAISKVERDAISVKVDSLASAVAKLKREVR
jgi:hypothetical protein